jgi:hypothetical protein
MRWSKEDVVKAAGLFALGCALCGSLATPAAAQTDIPPTAAQKQPGMSDMALVGYNDLQARSAYQPVIKKQGDRWIAYIGHHGGTELNPLNGEMEANGTSVLDVTDPKNPKYLFHIPGEAIKGGGTPGGGGSESGGAQMVRVCSGSDLPHADKSKFYLLRNYGNTAQEMWDVTNPAKPTRIAVIASGLRDTHKNWWECNTGIAYLVSGVPDWRTLRLALIYDLSNPAKPVFIRTFGLPGQQPGSTGPLPGRMHGPISTGPKGNRVYFAFESGGSGIFEIVDRDKLLNGPKEPTEDNLRYPVIGRVDLPPDMGSHTAFPLLQMEIPEFAKQKIGKVKDFLAVVAESGPNECQEARQMLRIFDISTESMPIGVSTWTVPEASGNFCDKGGRYGTHSTNESFSPIYYKRVLFVAHFSAGLRALDIRDPYHPKEIAYYIPAITKNTDKRCVGKGADEKCKIAIQTNNVEVDDRGYIYITDRANTGLHILELTGPARQVADFSQAGKPPVF